MVGVDCGGGGRVQAVLIMLVLALYLAAESVVFGLCECSYRVSRNTCCEVDLVKDVFVVRRWDVVFSGSVSVWWYGCGAVVYPGPDFSRDVV